MRTSIISPPIGTVDIDELASYQKGEEGRETKLTEDILQAPLFDSRVLVNNFRPNDCCLRWRLAAVLGARYPFKVRDLPGNVSLSPSPLRRERFAGVEWVLDLVSGLWFQMPY